MKKLCSILLAICLLAGLGALCSVPAAAVDPYDPSDILYLNRNELLDYFNLVVNRVRTEKPSFQHRELLRIDSMQSSILGGMMDGLLNSVVAALTSSDWTQTGVNAGQSNEGMFLSENANASDLRPQDITSINAKKVGDNWVIEVGVKEESNPAAGLNSSNGRISPVATREQIVAEVNSGGVTANAANATVRYGSGFARVTVNGQGQVIAAANGHQANALFKNVKISIMTADVAATMNSEWQCAFFDWAPEEDFPAANAFPPAVTVTFDPDPGLTLKWWQRLPAFLQWILRWFFLGWLWMR